MTSRDGRGDQGGRVTAGNLVCTNGTVAVTGTKLRQLGGLRSDWFSIVSAVQLHYTALGGSAGPLGAALGAELTTPDGRGAYQHYAGGSIYASPATGAHEVRGAIRSRWASLGWENGMGFPTTGDTRTPAGTGYYTHFQGGSVYWSPTTGAQALRGAILQEWASLGWENGLGFPTTSDTPLPGGRGWFTTFQGGSVYWSPTTGAHAVRGGILDTWAAQGWEKGPLGLPTADERWTGATLTQTFQGGTLSYDPRTGKVARA